MFKERCFNVQMNQDNVNNLLLWTSEKKSSVYQLIWLFKFVFLTVLISWLLIIWNYYVFYYYFIFLKSYNFV